MTKVTRTAEEIYEYCKYHFRDNVETTGENIDRCRVMRDWLTQSEPTIEELRLTRPWHDINVGEVIRCWTRDNEESTSWLYFTESLSPLGLEFAQIVQWLNGALLYNEKWFAHLQAAPVGHVINYAGAHFALTSVHKLHYAKDEATIRRAVEIFGEDKFKKMLGVV